MTKQALTTAIDAVVGNNYSIRTVGITNDPERRKGEHESDGESVKFWRHWKADSERIARDVEAQFLSKGCKGGSGGGVNPTYVYVF